MIIIIGICIILIICMQIVVQAMNVQWIFKFTSKGFWGFDSDVQIDRRSWV